MIRAYYQLTKPGIIYGNAVTFAAGFFLAAKGHISWTTFFYALFGLSLVIACGCVFNNYLDRKIDAQMQRTKQRVLVTGEISSRSAIIFGTVLGLIGIFLLGFFVNALTLAIALTGALVYLVFYGVAKRRTIYGPLVGSISGAVPPVVGYTAITNRFDLGAAILFFILVFWQMPHFYSIAIYRLDDYIHAGIPVLPSKKGIKRTKIEILAYIVLFLGAIGTLHFLHYAGKVYLIFAGLLSISWLVFALKGFSPETVDKTWARKMFFFSLFVLTGISILLAINSLV